MSTKTQRRPLEWEGAESHYVIVEVPMQRGPSMWQVYDNRFDAEFMAYGYGRRFSSLEAALREVVGLLEYDYAVAEGY